MSRPSFLMPALVVRTLPLRQLFIDDRDLLCFNSVLQVAGATLVLEWTHQLPLHEKPSSWLTVVAPHVMQRRWIGPPQMQLVLTLAEKGSLG